MPACTIAVFFFGQRRDKRLFKQIQEILIKSHTAFLEIIYRQKVKIDILLYHLFLNDMSFNYYHCSLIITILHLNNLQRDHALNMINENISI